MERAIKEGLIFTPPPACVSSFSEWVVLSFSLFFRVKSLLYLVYHIRIVIRLSSPSDRQALYTASQARRLRYHDCANRLVANIVDGSKHDGGLR